MTYCKRNRQRTKKMKKKKTERERKKRMLNVKNIELISFVLFCIFRLIPTNAQRRKKPQSNKQYCECFFFLILYKTDKISAKGRKNNQPNKRKKKDQTDGEKT